LCLVRREGYPPGISARKDDSMTRRILCSALLAAALLSANTASAQAAGATLFEGPWLTGERIALDRDVFDLNDTPFGARRTSSVDVTRGCRVTLYELSGYRGQSVELTEHDNNLGNTRLGKGSVASVRVDCRGGNGGEEPRGVTLYRDSNLLGPSQIFEEDVPDLERTRFGARRASSIEVPDGCMATLFSEPGYRGRSTTFRGNNNKLKNTEVGVDSASSLRVDCGRRPHHRPPPVIPPTAAPPAPTPPADRVTLFRDKKLGGPSEEFRSDVPDLALSRIGAGTASSIYVPSGCRATLYSEPSYQGRSTSFAGPNNELKNTPVGNDAAQSIRVECGQRRR